ncbi:MAG: DegT/DnrJ/EryC1/StrS family aminotransferase [Wenzhouxiangella sp.]
MNGARLIPTTPTLYPSMLLARAAEQRLVPFGGGDVHWYLSLWGALVEACRLLELGDGEVLIPAYHHGLEVEALATCGVKPVFYKVDASWRVDLADLERRIGPNTRALYLIHYAGFPGPALRMRQLANEYGLALLEDCSLSLLSSEGVSNLGTRGDVSVFRFDETLPVPHGAALKFNKPRHGEVRPLQAPPATSLMRLIMSLIVENIETRGGLAGGLLWGKSRRWSDRKDRAGAADRVLVGDTLSTSKHPAFAMSNFARRIAYAQPMDQIVAVRRRNYLALHQRLKARSPPFFKQLDPGVCPLFFPLWAEDKSATLAKLHSQGIGATDFWSQHHPDCDPSEFPDVMRARQHVVRIPCHQDLSPAKMAWLADELELALRTCPKVAASDAFAHGY